MVEQESPLRLRLILGKFQVIDKNTGLIGFVASIKLGSGVVMQMDCPPQADLRIGDWLTYYTECPYAQPSPTPIQ